MNAPMSQRRTTVAGITSSNPAASAYPGTAESTQSAVSWGAIICGAIVAAAVSLILLALGVGLNLASVSPWADRGVSAATFTVMTAVWFIIIQWLASAAGGYLTGRFRTRWVSLHTHEVFFRDTAHGFATWSLATLLTAWLFTSAAGSMLAGGAHAAETAVAGASQAAAGAASGPAGYHLDTLLRGAKAEANGAGADVRGEISRIVMSGVSGKGVTAADRSYLASLVASQTGISPADAEQRVNTFINDTKATLDSARKTTSETALFTALSMLIGAFVACAAAAIGGRRRDANAEAMPD